MRLLTYAKNGEQRVGVGLDDGVVDLATALATAGQLDVDASSVLAIIRSGVDIDAVWDAAAASLGADGLAAHHVEGFTWLPPIPRPPKILALALNYYEHVEETREVVEFRDEPIVFAKYASNMIGHEGTIVLPPFPQKVDEELELAVVFSRDARHISVDEAPDHVFGYTICNDVSARHRQRQKAQQGQPYSYAKNFATFCPMGPWIVTKRDVPNPTNLDMEVRHDGKVGRAGNSSGMIYDPFEIMSYCSDYTQMEAGDIISLGTFAGDKQLTPGETLELEIKGIGVLRSAVVQDTSAWPNFPKDEPTGHLVPRRPRA